MRSRRVLTSGMTVLLAAMTLAACALVPETRITRLPTDSGSPQPTPSATPTATPTSTPTVPPASAPPGRATTGADCGGQPIVLDAGSPTWTISGSCPDVQVRGSELVIEAADADASILVVAGDRISVRLGTGGQVTVQGNDVFIHAGEISSLTVRGDRNTIETESTIGGVTFQGNDNAVRGHAAQVSDEGSRNTVG